MYRRFTLNLIYVAGPPYITVRNTPTLRGQELYILVQFLLRIGTAAACRNRFIFVNLFYAKVPADF